MVLLQLVLTIAFLSFDVLTQEEPLPSLVPLFTCWYPGDAQANFRYAVFGYASTFPSEVTIPTDNQTNHTNSLITEDIIRTGQIATFAPNTIDRWAFRIDPYTETSWTLWVGEPYQSRNVSVRVYDRNSELPMCASFLAEQNIPCNIPNLPWNVDEMCHDNVFCNGAEYCNLETGRCTNRGIVACEKPGSVCDENTKSCVSPSPPVDTPEPTPAPTIPPNTPALVPLFTCYYAADVQDNFRYAVFGYSNSFTSEIIINADQDGPNQTNKLTSGGLSRSGQISIFLANTSNPWAFKLDPFTETTWRLWVGEPHPSYNLSVRVYDVNTQPIMCATLFTLQNLSCNIPNLPWSIDDMCDDGLFCNGVEYCNVQTGHCENRGLPPVCEAGCDESAKTCVTGSVPPSATPETSDNTLTWFLFASILLILIILAAVWSAIRARSRR